MCQVSGSETGSSYQDMSFNEWADLRIGVSFDYDRVFGVCVFCQQFTWTTSRKPKTPIHHRIPLN